jgi:hypothetical protein
MDRFVIFNKATGKRYGMEYGSYKEWKTESAAKAALTRLKKKHLKRYLEGSRDMDHCPDWKMLQGLCDSVIVTYDYFYENEPMVERTNLQGGNKYMERLNTPYFLSPSRDSYYR